MKGKQYNHEEIERIIADKIKQANELLKEVEELLDEESHLIKTESQSRLGELINGHIALSEHSEEIKEKSGTSQKD
ncbi:hypothetical protein Marpi_1523 [Marinitoga piezophila KA3]|uniref:Uncharacterized protein n=1 Tax=Marinitoga piezophila (strain DSM 14283 / JCM 11233 / KA3) TaxID=443254 RepID=H2J4A2_MARPK|nr:MULTISPECIES: hypothetical protein [Marinitoga]AEX85917.1 hypothetical protein Marpi_1523 [Marinitoga piezophila KA3]APT76347.1 hypothetical protein LN42_08120 [Marinitoga sp. 1137]